MVHTISFGVWFQSWCYMADCIEAWHIGPKKPSVHHGIVVEASFQHVAWSCKAYKICGDTCKVAQLEINYYTNIWSYWNAQVGRMDTNCKGSLIYTINLLTVNTKYFTHTV